MALPPAISTLSGTLFKTYLVWHSLPPFLKKTPKKTKQNNKRGLSEFKLATKTMRSIDYNGSKRNSYIYFFCAEDQRRKFNHVQHI